jgi:hypothetical protein
MEKARAKQLQPHEYNSGFYHELFLRVCVSPYPIKGLNPG